jgi:ABC-type transport system involved in cytochrome c biogenesis permease subunit
MERYGKIIKYCAFGSLIALLTVLATATVVEKLMGSEFVHKQIYGAGWFVALWAILAISAIVYIIRKKPFTVRRSPFTLLLHFSLIIILLGALITYLTGTRGYAHIRQGEIANFYISEENAVKQSLPFNVKLLLFDIEYHPNTNEPADYISFLKIDEEVCRVSMNKIFKRQGYRLYQMDYDADEMGTILLVSYDPYGVAVTYSGYVLLAISMLGLLLVRIGWKGMLYTFVPVAGLWYYISQLNPMTPVLRSPLLAAHVSVIMVSYLLLLTITVLSIIGLSSKKSREKLYRLNKKILYPALFLLAAGIFIGAFWANISWGRYWGWDAKETWALITLLVYAFPFHKTGLPFFRNRRKFHIYCIIAFFSILMTFFGVSYILGGIHSYV